jgi:ElaB/YqjD/DUF883 family membrane-anchored ribosome-binding protein
MDADRTAGTAETGGLAGGDDPRSEVEQLRAQVERLAAEPATPRLDAAARTAERYDRQLDHYLDRIRERPLAAIGAAAFVGFLAGRFLGGSTVHRI